jgi:hypothetical protein
LYTRHCGRNAHAREREAAACNIKFRRFALLVDSVTPELSLALRSVDALPDLLNDDYQQNTQYTKTLAAHKKEIEIKRAR